jgi:hypothetical protein
MSKSFTIRVDSSAVNKLFDDAEAEMYAAARVAAQAGAQILYDQVKQNVSKIGVQKGNLKNSIYQVFDKEASVKVGTFAGRDVYSRATYSISWRTARTGTGTIAPHGALIEYGYLQRYASYVGKDGKWYTAVRPEMQGKPKPRRNAPQSVKDAYYVPRKGGPIQHPARPFVRAAVSAFDRAADAMTAAFTAELQRKGVAK